MAKIHDALPDLKREIRFFPVDNTNPKHLSAEQLDQYNTLGYIAPLDLFEANEAIANREYFDGLMARAAAKGHNSYSINGWQRTCPEMYDLIADPRISDYISDLFGENLICWGAHFFCKQPGDEKRVSWHQDASYWPISPSQTATVWLAIDDADEGNGAMKVIPRSHLHGQIDFEDTTRNSGDVLGQSVTDALEYGDEPVTIALRAGQISIHSDLLLHGSEPNPSTRRRCGLTMRFIPPSVRALTNWNGQSMFTRGTDPSGHWANNPRPEHETIPDPRAKRS